MGGRHGRDSHKPPGEQGWRGPRDRDIGHVVPGHGGHWGATGVTLLHPPSLLPLCHQALNLGSAAGCHGCARDTHTPQAPTGTGGTRQGRAPRGAGGPAAASLARLLELN